MSQEPPTPGRIKPIPDTREPDRGTGGRAEAGSPSDGPLADGTLADKPVADEPFADGPVTDGPLADGMLAESESPLPTEAEGTTEGHGEDDIDLSGGKTLSDYVRDEDLPG